MHGFDTFRQWSPAVADNVAVEIQPVARDAARQIIVRVSAFHRTL